MSTFTTFIGFVIIFFGADAVSAHAKPASASAKNKPVIVTSITPLMLITRDLTGDHAVVTALVKGHASAHHFSLALSDQKTLQRADSVIWIGPALEQFLVKSIAMRIEKQRHTLSSLSLLNIHSRHEHTTRNHTQSEHDPHIWTSPVLVAQLYQKLAYELSQQYPQMAQPIANNLNAALLALQGIQSNSKPLLMAKAQNKHFFVYHDALSHFIHDFSLPSPYALTQVPDESISAKQLGTLYKKAKTASCLMYEINEERLAQRYSKKLKLKAISFDLLATQTYNSYADYLSSIIQQASHCFSDT